MQPQPQNPNNPQSEPPQSAPKRVLCIMDLSCLGRAGLSVVLPALSACGVQACGLPAALFSAHTGGFGAVQKQNEAAFGQTALEHWQREDVGFDAVYTGYLYGQDQFELARRALALYPNALQVSDPALGDDGAAYSGLGPHTVEAMRALCQTAALITPNYTESALLAGLTPDMRPPTEAEITERLDLLCRGGRAVLITSVPVAGGGAKTCGRDAAGHSFAIETAQLPQRYPGSGDLLCAATLGLMQRHGWPLEAAARRATAFVGAAVRHSWQNGAEPRCGLWFEPLLSMLTEAGEPAEEEPPQ